MLVTSFPQSSSQISLYQTPGRRPPPVTVRFVNTVTRGLVGAPNGRAPLRFHGAVVGFVDRCLSRTRNLAASNKHQAEFFSGRSWPKICPGIIRGFQKSLKTFLPRFVLIASGTEIVWRVSLKSQFVWKPRVSIITGLRLLLIIVFVRNMITFLCG